MDLLCVIFNNLKIIYSFLNVIYNLSSDYILSFFFEKNIKIHVFEIIHKKIFTTLQTFHKFEIQIIPKFSTSSTVERKR